MAASHVSGMTPSQSAPSLTSPPGGSAAASMPIPQGGASGFASPPGAGTVPRTGMSVSQLSEQLQKAILSGDEEQARQIASRLARQRSQLEISPDTTSPQEQEIKMKVYVEDRDTWGSFVTLKVRPSMTIARLKRKMLQEYGFPPEVQKWIVGRRLPQDTESLARCGVNRSGVSIFLYLVTAESVGLDKKTYREKYGHLFHDQPNISEITHSAGNAGVSSPAAPHHGDREVSHDLHIQSGQSTEPPDLQAATAQPEGTPTRKVSAGQRPPAERAEQPQNNVEEEARKIGWSCPQCTFQNLATRPGCEMCGRERPADYKVPDNVQLPLEERDRLKVEQELEMQYRKAEAERQKSLKKERKRNFQSLVEAEGLDLVPNQEVFTCLICWSEIHPGEGVILRECLHMFCRSCLISLVELSEEPEVACPHKDDTYTCSATLQEVEIRALVSQTAYGRHLQRSVTTAESSMEGSYHCKTPNCPGWCVYEDDVNFFNCEVCNQQNCLTCKAIHEGMSCRDYQEDLRLRAEGDEEARQTHQAIRELVEAGEAMRCPKCDIILLKKEGCDWIQCSMCKTEICWVTKGYRWGPKGNGDISGGCMCRVDGRQCHPNCGNCH